MLTHWEHVTATHVAQDLSNQEIASKLAISQRTEEPR
jgi:FixJ family two-component response regulator